MQILRRCLQLESSSSPNCAPAEILYLRSPQGKQTVEGQILNREDAKLTHKCCRDIDSHTETHTSSHKGWKEESPCLSRNVSAEPRQHP